MDHPEHHAHPRHHDGPGYEVKDAQARPVLISFGVILGGTALCMIFLVWLMGQLAARPLRPPTAIPPVNLYQQLDRLHKDENQTLGGYSYDRKTGVAQIPIDRAIDLIVERGVPKGKGPRTPAELNRRDQPKGEK